MASHGGSRSSPPPQGEKNVRRELRDPPVNRRQSAISGHFRTDATRLPEDIEDKEKTNFSFDGFRRRRDYQDGADALSGAGTGVAKKIYLLTLISK